MFFQSTERRTCEFKAKSLTASSLSYGSVSIDTEHIGHGFSGGPHHIFGPAFSGRTNQQEIFDGALRSPLKRPWRERRETRETRGVRKLTGQSPDKMDRRPDLCE